MTVSSAHREPAGIVRQVGESVFRVAVRVKPNAQQTRIVGVNCERQCLEVALNAPPREGAANDELLRFLRECLSLTKSQARIVGGDKSRDKIVEIQCSREALVEILKI